ncbi:MAG: PTPDL family protein [Chthoniobacter sp.]
MSKFPPAIARTLAITMLVSGAFADTVTLKNGEHLEGKVTKETDKEVTIEVQVSAGIVDERILPRAEIVKIDKMSPELVAYQALARIQLQPNSLPAPQYDQYIAALDAYVQQYPTSPSAGEVRKTLNAFVDEQKRVEGGAVKLNGSWLTKEQVEKEKVQINGQLTFNYMKAQSTAGEYVDALNAFAALEKTYPGASVMPDAIELARKIIPALQAELERAIPEQKVLVAQRDKGAKNADPAQRAQIQAAAKQEDAAAEAAAAAADAGNRWAPMIKNNAKCLTSLQLRAVKEKTRLAALKPAAMRQSLQLAENARQSLASGNTEAANVALKEATALWKDNELALRLAKPPATPEADGHWQCRPGCSDPDRAHARRGIRARSDSGPAHTGTGHAGQGDTGADPESDPRAGYAAPLGGGGRDRGGERSRAERGRG